MLFKGCQPHSPRINEEVAFIFIQSLTAHSKCFKISHYLHNYVFGGYRCILFYEVLRYLVIFHRFRSFFIISEIISIHSMGFLLFMSIYERTVTFLFLHFH